MRTKHLDDLGIEAIANYLASIVNYLNARPAGTLGWGTWTSYPNDLGLEDYVPAGAVFRPKPNAPEGSRFAVYDVGVSETMEELIEKLGLNEEERLYLETAMTLDLLEN